MTKMSLKYIIRSIRAVTCAAHQMALRGGPVAQRLQTAAVVIACTSMEA